MNKQLTRQDLDELVAGARALPRRRLNRNLHPQGDDPVNRLAIAIEPDSYIRPHRHDRWELIILLAGTLDLLLWDEQGRLTSRQRLCVDAIDSNCARVVEYPAGSWHSLVSQQSGTVFFEVKSGPYAPSAPGDFAAWAPAENEPGAQAFLRAMNAVVVGACAAPLHD
jgi:cupin fold WbuC family metalloprotein